MGADPAVRVSVPTEWAEVAGATLMDLLGPYQEVKEADRSHLVFYPFRHGAGYVSDEELLAVLPADGALRSRVVIERVLVPEGWEEGWRNFFRPLTVGRIYVRPPWEPPPLAGPLFDVVLTPGLAFGTGLHPTTRGVLALMQDAAPEGPLTDAGTGSGILSIAAGLLGFQPVRAFDNDPLAVEATRTNAAVNGVEVDVRLCDVTSAPREWLGGTTVLANMTLEPVRELLGLLPRMGGPVRRLVAAGILAGDQEAELLECAAAAGLRPARLIYEDEWVSLDLRPGEGR